MPGTGLNATILSMRTSFYRPITQRILVEGAWMGLCTLLAFAWQWWWTGSIDLTTEFLFASLDPRGSMFLNASAWGLFLALVLLIATVCFALRSSWHRFAVRYLNVVAMVLMLIAGLILVQAWVILPKLATMTMLRGLPLRMEAFWAVTAVWVAVCGYWVIAFVYRSRRRSAQGSASKIDRSA